MPRGLQLAGKLVAMSGGAGALGTAIVDGLLDHDAALVDRLLTLAGWERRHGRGAVISIRQFHGLKPMARSCSRHWVAGQAPQEMVAVLTTFLAPYRAALTGKTLS